MSASDIVYENGDYWVAREKRSYTVYQSGITHSVSDSAYAKSADGLTLAVTRCDYKAKCGELTTHGEKVR